jgi:hypothetical protein
MITETDAYQTIETDTNFIIIPMLYERSMAKVTEQYSAHHDGRPVPEGFSYNSGRNSEWLTVARLRQLIREHVDASFDLQ